MQEFQWIVSVCEDLAAYAEEHGLNETTRAARSAARITQLELKMAESLRCNPTEERGQAQHLSHHLQTRGARGFGSNEEPTNASFQGSENIVSFQTRRG